MNAKMNAKFLYYTKVRDVKSPTRGTSRSAGIDFYVPTFDDKFIVQITNKNKNLSFDGIRFLGGSLDPVTLTADEAISGIMLFEHERILIPSGIHVNIPEGYALIAHNKSGVASKKGLDILAEVIDEDYQGEVHLSVYNTGTEPQMITQGEKLIQCILTPVLYADLIEIENLETLYPVETERKDGGFGSTNEEKK